MSALGAEEDDAALIALLRTSQRTPAQLADDLEAAGAARPVLARERDQPTPSAGEAPRLFAETPANPTDVEELLSAARRDLERWAAQGVSIRTLLRPDYPPNLRTVHDRPPLLFSRGREAIIRQPRAIAVIGTRDATALGLQLAGDISTRLVALEYVVVSGLATGIDAAAHGAALAAGGRTIAVIGTGLNRVYPPKNADLQRAIADRGAVLSQFWPDDPPRREHFPLRNALMSGVARGTVIVEAGARSGTRIQARAALAHGRPVFLHELLLQQPWARDLATAANVHVITGADEAVGVLERIHRSEPLSA